MKVANDLIASIQPYRLAGCPDGWLAGWLIGWLAA